ncbi:MAG: hypothetical protein IPP63_08325 [Chloracidobacterium sp.]|nr:hypothetical protein [Chloracidobacterium sp.]
MGDTSEKADNLQDAMVKYQRSAEIYKQIADLDVRNTLACRDLAQSYKSVGMTAIKLLAAKRGSPGANSNAP